MSLLVISPDSFNSDKMDIYPTITIYTDGSRKTEYNTATGGIGIAEIHNNGEIREISINGGVETDINILEAKAVLIYLQYFSNIDDHIIFKVDSQTLIDRIYYLYNNIEMNCKTYNSRRLQSIIIEIVNILKSRLEKTTFEKVVSHTNVKLNDLADKLSKTARYIKNMEVSYSYTKKVDVY